MYDLTLSVDLVVVMFPPVTSHKVPLFLYVVFVEEMRLGSYSRLPVRSFKGYIVVVCTLISTFLYVPIESHNLRPLSLRLVF